METIWNCLTDPLPCFSALSSLTFLFFPFHLCLTLFWAFVQSLNSLFAFHLSHFSLCRGFFVFFLAGKQILCFATWYVTQLYILRGLWRPNIKSVFDCRASSKRPEPWIQIFHRISEPGHVDFIWSSHEREAESCKSWFSVKEFYFTLKALRSWFKGCQVPPKPNWGNWFCMDQALCTGEYRV